MLCFILVLFIEVAKARTRDITHDLLARFDHIDILARPTENISLPTLIHLGMDLQHIMNVVKLQENRPDGRVVCGAVAHPFVHCYPAIKGSIPVQGRT